MSSPMGIHPGRALRSFQQDQSAIHTKISRAHVRRIIAIARPYRWHIAGLLVLLGLDAAAGAANPLVLRHLLDNGVAAGSARVTVIAAGVLVALALGAGALSIAERWVTARIGEGIVRDLRTRVFDHVQRLPLAFFSRTRTGALVQRVNGDVVGAQQVFTSTLSSVVSNTLTVVFVLAAMFAMSWQLTLAALAVLPLFIVPAKRAAPRMARIAQARYAANADAAQVMNERFSITGALLVKSFGRPADESATFRASAQAVHDLGIRQAMTGTMLRVGLATVSAVAVALLYGFGGLAAIAGTLTIGTVVALASYLTRLYGPLVALSNVQIDVMTALVSFDRVLEVLDLVPTVRDSAHPHDLTADVATHGASVDFDRVTFTYPSAAEVSLPSLEAPEGTRGADQTDSSETGPSADARSAVTPVLNDITMHLAPGTMTALVGHSGAGKTTLGHLVSRLYDPTQGAVRIAGRDLRDASLESIGRTVGVVSQDAHLFHDTVAANLRYARPDATDAELWEALREAYAPDVVERLPRGLDTVVGDGGLPAIGGRTPTHRAGAAPAQGPASRGAR